MGFCCLCLSVYLNSGWKLARLNWEHHNTHTHKTLNDLFDMRHNTNRASKAIKVMVKQKEAKNAHTWSGRWKKKQTKKLSQLFEWNSRTEQKIGHCCSWPQCAIAETMILLVFFCFVFFTFCRGKTTERIGKKATAATTAVATQTLAGYTQFRAYTS